MNDLDERNLDLTFTRSFHHRRRVHDHLGARKKAAAEEPDEQRRQCDKDRDAEGEIANAEEDLRHGGMDSESAILLQSRRGEFGDESGFIPDINAEFLRFGEFAAGFGARNHNRGLLRHAARDLRARALQNLGRLAAAEMFESSRDNEGLSCECVGADFDGLGFATIEINAHGRELGEDALGLIARKPSSE